MNTRRPIPKARRHQAGALLLEALIAILIFSLGILGVVGLQTTALQQSSDAKYRSEAAQLVEDLLGEMWTTDRTVATLQAQYSSCSTCPAYQAWYARVALRLPGVAATGPTAPSVNIDGDGLVTINVRWKPPTDEASANARHCDSRAQIK